MLSRPYWFPDFGWKQFGDGNNSMVSKNQYGRVPRLVEIGERLNRRDAWFHKAAHTAKYSVSLLISERVTDRI